MNRNSILLIVFVLLLAIFLGKRFLGGDDSRNFREVLVEVDTAAVTKIVLYTKANDHEAVELIKTSATWDVKSGNISDEADKGSIGGMLSSLVKITPKRLVAKSGDKWAQYEVNDSLGTQVKVYNGDKLLADVIIGKFNFQQATRSMSTFVRLGDDKDVYSVDGFLSSTFNQPFNGFRDKTFLETNKTDLASLKFDYPGDSSFVLSKIGEKWQVNETMTADSASVESFLNGLRSIRQRDFVDGFVSTGKSALYQLTVDGNNMSPIVVQGFQEGEGLVLHSSLNENAFFEEGGLNAFEKLFVPAGQFFETTGE